MEIRELLLEGKNILKQQNIEDYNIIAKEILLYLLKKDKQYLIVNAQKSVNDNTHIKYIYLINKIANGTPVQYITHKQEFMGLNFNVNKSVLIPQPDTEIVVENVLKLYKDNFSKKNEIKILDLCTGSGAIAISIDKILNKYDNIEVYASDISAKALEVAIKNNEKNSTNVKFIRSDMFNNINQKFDIIISNPPYIRTEVIETLPKEVQNEPYIALNGGEDGLKFYKIIADSSYKYLKQNGYLCLEIGYDQKDEIVQLFSNSNNYKNIKALKDLSGNYRCIQVNLN